MGQRVEKGNHNEVSRVFQKVVIVMQENIFLGLISHCNNLSHPKARIQSCVAGIVGLALCLSGKTALPSRQSQFCL